VVQTAVAVAVVQAEVVEVLEVLIMAMAHLQVGVVEVNQMIPKTPELVTEVMEQSELFGEKVVPSLQQIQEMFNHDYSH